MRHCTQFQDEPEKCHSFAPARIIPHCAVVKQCPDCLGLGCDECNNTGKVEQ